MEAPTSEKVAGSEKQVRDARVFTLNNKLSTIN
jgi:hypothetical protein